MEFLFLVSLIKISIASGLSIVCIDVLNICIVMIPLLV
jgi:hypothetical protein